MNNVCIRLNPLFCLKGKSSIIIFLSFKKKLSEHWRKIYCGQTTKINKTGTWGKYYASNGIQLQNDKWMNRRVDRGIERG